MVASPKYNPWNKYLLGAVAALGLLAGLSMCTPPTYAMPTAELPALYEEVLLPSVQINKNCSGTIVSAVKNPDGTQTFEVLTAKHCMKSKDPKIMLNEEHIINIPLYVNGKIFGDISLKADVTKIAKGDMVILTVKDVFIPFTVTTAKVADFKDIKDLKFGQDVFCISYGAAQTPVLTLGTLGFLEEVKGFGWAQRASCPTIRGSSGSGLFVREDDGSFELIGTLTGGWGESFNFYSPLDELARFMEQEDTKAPEPVVPTPPVGLESVP